MQLKDLEQLLNSYLNVSLFQDYGPNGLQVEGKKEVKKIATCVSASYETIEKAIAENVDVLIAHHGLFWNGLSPCIVGPHKERIALLLKHEISLLAYHLPLDAHIEVGNNWKAAQALSWSHLEPFAKIGVKGTCTPRGVEELVEVLERFYQHKATVALFGKKIVERVALVSGNAYKNINEAIGDGIDLFITGAYDEPAWWAAKEGKINFVAIGHTATEKVGPQALADYIATKTNTEAIFIDIENPF